MDELNERIERLVDKDGVYRTEKVAEIMSEVFNEKYTTVNVVYYIKRASVKLPAFKRGKRYRVNGHELIKYLKMFAL